MTRNHALIGTLWAFLGVVHVDLHGFLLSPDFEASIKDGKYQPGKGTVWILSDGGIYRSTDGGKQFHPAKNVRTLACLKVAGVSTNEHGPALSLNTGDNDGFYSMDGSENWSYQDYGGGDNDGAFADPLRPQPSSCFVGGRATGIARINQCVDSDPFRNS